MSFKQAKIFDDIFKQCVADADANDGKINPNNVVQHFLSLMDDSVDKGKHYFDYIYAQQTIEKFGLIQGHSRMDYTSGLRLPNASAYWTITSFGKKFLKMPDIVRWTFFFFRLSWRKISGFLAAFGFITILARAWSGFEILEGWMGYVAAALLTIAAVFLTKHKDG